MQLTSARTLISAVLLSALPPLTAMADAPYSLDLAIDRQRLYPGQSALLTVTLTHPAESLPGALAYPRLAAAEGVSVAEFATPGHSVADRNGRTVSRLEFRAGLTAVTPGSHLIGPAQIRAEQRQPAAGGSFFGETSTVPVTITSAPLTLTVLPLPTEGRPADFSGAVGTFSITTSVTPHRVEPGDPLTVTTVISGSGDLAGTVCPQVSAKGFRGYPPVARRADGRLECRQTVLPPHGATEVPPLAFSFFDSDTSRYRTVTSAAAPFSTVSAPAPPTAPLTRAAAPDSAQPPGGSRSSSSILLPGILFCAAALCACALLRRRRTHNGAPPHPETVTAGEYMQAAAQALSDGDGDRFHLCAFRAAQQLLAAAPAGDRRREVLTELIDRCDAVRYGRRQSSPEEMRNLLDRLRRCAP